jgi:uncharacterized peroxidase-related enzyme
MAPVPGVRVPMVEEADATGRVAELYDNIKAKTGFPFVPDMFRLSSSRPALLNVISTGYQGVFIEDAVLERRMRELIAAWTSKVNGCPYCVGTHNWFLGAFGGSEELKEAVANSDSVEDLPLDEREKELMRLITKVSLNAYKVVDSDWEKVAAHGWSNEEILEAVFCACLFNFINRLVDSTGLGTSVQQSRISKQPDANDESAA